MRYFIGCIYDDGCRDVKVLAYSAHDAYDKLARAKGVENIVLYPRLPREDENIEYLEEIY